MAAIRMWIALPLLLAAAALLWVGSRIAGRANSVAVARDVREKLS